MQTTEQNILKAAILVFNEDFSAPLEKVAERAAVTRRTLHRHFTGRAELLESCAQEIQRNCTHAMAQALDSSDNLLTQLENVLYAVVDCGAQYPFFNKLHTRPGHQHSPHNADCAGYDAVCGRFAALIQTLRAQGHLSPHLTVEWVLLLFNGVVTATTSVADAGSLSTAQLRQFAWFSFSRGIGL